LVALKLAEKTIDAKEFIDTVGEKKRIRKSE
jgi:hypothetical protein